MKFLPAILFLSLLTHPIYAQITMQKHSEGILVMENTDSVLFYQTAQKDHNGEFERTNYIHPLWNVDGTVMTEDFPADHLHQRGVYWAWHQILIDGKRIGDGWALEDFEQEVIDTDWHAQKDGSAILSTRVNWKSDLWKEHGSVTPYIEEMTEMTIHPKKKNYRRIDFMIQLTPLVDQVSIGGSEDVKGYSGFSVRMKLPEDVLFTGPAGKLEPQNTAVSSPGYVNVSGTFDGYHPGGILILDNPENPGYPQSWILRAKKSMQNPAYPGRHLVTINASRPLILKYSLVTYEGKLNKNTLKKMGTIR